MSAPDYSNHRYLYFVLRHRSMAILVGGLRLSRVIEAPANGLRSQFHIQFQPTIRCCTPSMSKAGVDHYGSIVTCTENAKLRILVCGRQNHVNEEGIRLIPKTVILVQSLVNGRLLDGEYLPPGGHESRGLKSQCRICKCPPKISGYLLLCLSSQRPPPRACWIGRLGGPTGCSAVG